MKITVTTLILLSLFILPNTISGMDSKKDKSCGARSADCILQPFNRTIFAYCLGQHILEPSSFEDAKSFFGKKQIEITERLVNLEEDQHLRAVATKVKLNGLSLFASKLARDSVLYDACTGASIAEFKDGRICHAIAIPHELCKDTNQHYPLICGIVEREIARISVAYTTDDIEITKFKQNLSWMGYCLIATAGMLYHPYSLLVTGPAGLMGESVMREGTEIAHEFDCDTNAALLAQTTDNLMATLMKSTSSFHLAELDRESAQKALDDQTEPLKMRLRAQRIYRLLELKDELEKNE